MLEKSVERHGRLPPKLFIFCFLYENLGVEPPVPPMPSYFLLSLKNIHNAIIP